MKKLLVTGLFVFAGCAKTEKVTVTALPGKDGYSVVASSTKDLNMCGLGKSGTQVTLALDLDRSLDFSEGDLVQTQFVTCDGVQGETGVAGLGCTVQKVGAVATISCGEQVVVVNDGNSGQDGKSAYEVWLDLGNNGSEQDFINSLVGPKGEQGVSGTNGLSAYQIWLSLGNTGTEAQFISSLTGPVGPAGSPGVNASGIYIVEFLNPCGAEFANDEVLMKMSNGKVVGVYDGGPNEDRLTIFAPGDYKTTDRNNNNECRFKITSSGNLSDQKLCQGSSNHCTSVGGQ